LLLYSEVICTTMVISYRFRLIFVATQINLIARTYYNLNHLIVVVVVIFPLEDLSRIPGHHATITLMLYEQLIGELWTSKSYITL